VLDDRTVVDECCFFGGLECTKMIDFAMNTELCHELLPNLVHSSIPSGHRPPPEDS
jgi:hypothetical protein